MAQLATVHQLRPREEITLTALAKECLEKSGGNRTRALKIMRKRLEEPKLQRTLIDPMIDLAIETALRQAQTATRNQAKRVALAPPDDTTGLRQVAQNTREELFLNYGISSGPLGDATKDNLVSERDQHWARAEGSQKMGNLMHYLARKLEKNTVRQQFKEEELAEAFAKFLK